MGQIQEPADSGTDFSLGPRKQLLERKISKQCAPPGPSPNNGKSVERTRLHSRFASRLQVNPDLSRQLVSYQGNRDVPGLRWFKYKEGFSQALVKRFLNTQTIKKFLDPFAGSGTAPLVVAGQGIQSIGIDVSPVGTLSAKAIAFAANGVKKSEFLRHGDELLMALATGRRPAIRYLFPHVAITEGAFSGSAEESLGKARRYISNVKNDEIETLLNAACMSVLEEVSYTRKDGQYLRWDKRSGRQLKTDMDKGDVPEVGEAIRNKISIMAEDFKPLKDTYGGTLPEFITGSSLAVLRKMKKGSVDLVVTSPPYANRYDYTRTYALELAWLGYGHQAFSELRQSMISSTVENKSKASWLSKQYGKSKMLKQAVSMYNQQSALREALDILRDKQSELSNKHVLRLIEGYFMEMAVIICELGRIVRHGGRVVMVNDNVQYHGEEIPVDLILADFAELAGFHCDRIEVLPRGKGNASQQMKRFGRREIRKCVYQWIKKDA